MDRRSVLKGGLVLAATAHTAASAPMVEDRLMTAIRAYQAGVAEFNRLSGQLDDWDALTKATYGPPLKALTEWNEPAPTLESAREALRIALNDDGGVCGCRAAESMVKAALGYLGGTA